MSSPELTRTNSTRRISRVLVHGAVLLFAILFVLVRHDYGVTWDAALGELYIGDKNLEFYLTLDPGYLDYDADNIPRYHAPGEPDFFTHSTYSRANSIHVWPLGPTLSSITKRVFAWKLGLVDVFEGHHLVNCFLGVLLAYALFSFLAWQGLDLAGFFAVIALFSYPRFWADIPNNLKDVPSTVFFSLTIFFLVRGVSSGRPGRVLASGAFAGMALAAKANAVFLPVILAPWLAAFLLEERRSRRSLPRAALLCAALTPLVALVVFFVLWPKLLCDFPSNLAEYIGFLRRQGTVGPAHWQTGPLRMAVSTMPESVMALVVLGLGALLLDNVRGRRRPSETILTITWLVVPVLRVSLPGALDFDGIRHWLEFTVPLAMLTGRGADVVRMAITSAVHRAVPRAADHAARSPEPVLGSTTLAALAAAVVSFSPALFEDVRIHPDQVCYFNRISGGLAGARRAGVPRATDYWGSSYREGERWLNEHAPPGSIVVVPIGEHIVELTATTWLRRDIRVADGRLLDAFLAQRDRTWTALGRPAMYLMSIAGHDFPQEAVVRAESEFPRVYVRSVDGADILLVLLLSATDPVARR